MNAESRPNVPQQKQSLQVPVIHLENSSLIEKCRHVQPLNQRPIWSHKRNKVFQSQLSEFSEKCDPICRSASRLLDRTVCSTLGARGRRRRNTPMPITQQIADEIE